MRRSGAKHVRIVLLFAGVAAITAHPLETPGPKDDFGEDGSYANEKVRFFIGPGRTSWKITSRRREGSAPDREAQAPRLGQRRDFSLAHRRIFYGLDQQKF
jgi:hypothetical protein